MAHYLSIALILSASLLNASSTYILSYRAQIKDAVVISESYYVTKSMQKHDNAPSSKQLRINAPNTTHIDDLLHQNKESIVDFLMQQGLHTRSFEYTDQLKSTSLITITIPTSYITVDFKNDYAIITRLTKQ